MRMKLFTKSAFKQALFCPTSLYYYYDDQTYANQNSEDDFLQALADGGNQAGDLAKVYYDVKPDADLSALQGYEKPLERTIELLKCQDVNIAEAAFSWGNCFVRADIIEKKGNVINLIEVKAKSWTTNREFTKGPDTVDPAIREYVYDVAFQKYVIQNALGPEFKIVAHLMLANKSVVADIDGINQLFKVVRTPDGKSKIVRQPGVDALRNKNHKHILTAFDEFGKVDELCDRIIAGKTSEQPAVMGATFKDFVDDMSNLYVNHVRRDCPVSAKCFNCPFYKTDESPKNQLDGWKECWEKMAHFKDDDFTKPSVSELWCGNAGPVSIKQNLVGAGKYFLEDVEEADLPKSQPVKSGLTPAERRLLQIGLTTGNKKMLEPFKDKIFDGIYVDVEGLRKEMSTWVYPLHMIDFETTSVALPLYIGLRPYEQVAFQFSHHIIEADGSIRHADQYLNTDPHKNPNFEFVEKLKVELEKDNGTIFRYATHENSILRALHGQLEASDDYPRKQELMDFIDTITHHKEGSKEVAGPRDMVDLLDVVRKYYYHPSMKGSNSIKAVLPAVLNSSAAIQAKYSKPIYGASIPSKNYTGGVTKQWIETNPDGTVKLPVESPYHLLDSVASFIGVSDKELEKFDATYIPEGEQIANGGAALAAYTKLQFCSSAEAKALSEALLRYCELDTMSMVFIWEYFQEMIHNH